MAWSTREIAELAGTSLRAVRHYHEVGLLEEPARRANGYKQYGVAHLILRQGAPTDLPPEFASAGAAAKMSDADRSLVVVMTRVLGPRRLQAYADMLRDMPTDPTDREFEDLSADADERTRQDLADRMA